MSHHCVFSGHNLMYAGSERFVSLHAASNTMDETLDMDVISCMDDVMEGFLDSVDLNQLDTVELGELTNSILENPLEGLDNVSDSDSGISVGGDKTGMPTGAAPVGEGSDCFRERSPVVLSTQSDCILTDAVGPSMLLTSPTSSCSEETNRTNSISDSTSSRLNPIRIIRLTNGSLERHGKFQVGTTQPVSLPKVFPGFPVSAVSGSSVMGNNASSSAKGLIKVFPQTNKNLVTVAQLLEPTTTITNVTCASKKGDLNLTSFPDSTDIGAFLDEYDPATYSDASLEQHLLQNTGSSFSKPFQTGSLPIQGSDCSSLPPLSPTYLGSCDTFGTGECLLTRAHLERIRKKQERMIKNRHAASMSRLRKKEYLERLEMRYEQLKRENHHLWRQNEEWRMRCLQLEQALNNLQSQLTETSNDQSHQDSSTVTKGNDSASIGAERPNSSSTEVKSERHPSVESPTTVSPVRSVSITYPSTSTIMSSSFTRSAPRTGLCTLYAKSALAPNGSSKWTLNSNKLFSDHNPQNSQRSNQTRKTVLNSVVYSGKTGITDTIQSAVRPKLINLGGIISRHRPNSFQSTSRSKLIATTSLLTMFCLFSLNIFILPFNPVNTDETAGGSVPHLPAVKSWDRPRTGPFGQRVLLTVRSTEDEEQWDAKSPRVKCKFPNDDADCLDMQSDSLELNGTEPVHMLLGWIEEHEAFKVGSAFKNQETESKTPKSPVYESETFRNPIPLPTIRTLKENRSRRSPSVKSTSRHAASGLRRTQSTRVSDGKVPLFPNKVIPALNPNFTPPTLTKPPKFTTVSERGVQPFHPRTWASDELVNAAGRQNGTVYVILMQLDHVQLEAVNPTYQNVTRKITFIAPAHPLQAAVDRHREPIGIESRPSMLQVDCELINVSLIPPLQSSKTP